ncbi:Basement membrane-specific heparan sulfate proteoglycan core protein [Sparganum proliferum]
MTGSLDTGPPPGLGNGLRVKTIWRTKHLIAAIFLLGFLTSTESGHLPSVPQYRVDLHLRQRDDEVVLRCPAYHVHEGDIVVYEDAAGAEILRAAARHGEAVQRLKLPATSLYAANATHQRFCRVQRVKSDTQELQTVSLTEFIIHRTGQDADLSAAFEFFNYDPAETSVLLVKKGDSVIISCPRKSPRERQGEGRKKSEEVLWFRAAGEQPISSTKDNQLYIASTGPEDIGVYYCAWKDSAQRSSPFLTVTKFILKAEEDAMPARTPAETTVVGDHSIRFTCLQTVQPSDTIVWEKSGGIVLLNHAGDNSIIQRSTRNPNDIFCSVEGRRPGTHTKPENPPDLLLQRRRRNTEEEVSIEIEPKDEFRSAGTYDRAEFHCRVTGMQDGGRMVKWAFIPEGAVEEREVEGDAVITAPNEAPTTSVLVIENPQTQHAGQYSCSILNKQDVGRLVIEDRKVTANPESVTARPGSTVRFFCSVTLADGRAPREGSSKVSWYRNDRQALKPGREEIVSGTRGSNLAVLVVKQLDWSYHNVVYTCTDGFRKAEAKIMVQDACGPGQRSCGGATCIEESLFCNGVPDCPDGSDEIPERCRQCEPNQFACLPLNGKQPLKSCYLRFWHCDGDDDCGNGYDESNCPAPSTDTGCYGSYFTCPDSNRPIPRSYMCDGQADCEPNGEDELDCSLPSVIRPVRPNDVLGIEGTNLTLKCVVHGRPPPAVNWRFNWGPIGSDVPHHVENKVEDCERTVSHLTLVNIQPRAAGMYTCEGVNRAITLAPDYIVNVASGNICPPPLFNDAAWFTEMCLTCFCSNVSNQCRSLRGHAIADVDQYAKPSINDVQLVAYDNADQPTTEKLSGLQITDSTLTAPATHDQPVFIEGTFGLSGSWVNSYSLYLKADITLRGPADGYMPLSLITLEGNGQKIHYCPPKDRLALYTSEQGHLNQLQARLTERDGWSLDPNCGHSDKAATRAQMLTVLSNVEKIRFRVKHYENQESYSVGNIRREYVIPSDVPGMLHPEIESCQCPEGYTGLSCESCDKGWERDPKDPLKCRKACYCEECDEQGNCVACPANTTGPDCRGCKPGFYRREDQPETAPCLPCEKCGGGYAHVNKQCIAHPTAPDGYRCRCEARENATLLEKECDLCELPEPPEEANCAERPPKHKCLAEGTESVDENGDCVCKANPGRYKLDVVMTRKMTTGELEPIPLDEEGNPRIKHVYSESNEDQRGLPEDLLLYKPLTTDGVSHFRIQIVDTKHASSSSDIPIYRYLYGGQLSFRYKPALHSGSELTAREAQVIISIQSPKFGTVYTVAAFNPWTQRYEARFSEDWWTRGWLSQGVDGPESDANRLSRAALLRVLGTASSIGITVVANGNGLENTRIAGLAIEIAREMESDYESSGLPRAPVEVCDCPAVADGGRAQSPSCEGCTDLAKSTEVNLKPNGADFQCGPCTGPHCEICEPGYFKYDFLTGKVYETCQKGVGVDTEGRVVVAPSGSHVTLTCKATSEKGGIAVHTWRLPAQVPAKHPDVTQTRELMPFKVGGGKTLASPITSSAGLQIDNLRKEYSGVYECHVAALGANLTEPFYLLVRDPGWTPETERDPEDKLNAEFPVPMSVPEPLPKIQYLTAEVDKADPAYTILRGKVLPPQSLEDFHIIWMAPNNTQLPVEDADINVGTGEFSARVPVNLTELHKEGQRINGFLVGKDPIKTPIWVSLPAPTTKYEEPTPDELSLVKLDRPSMNLSFLDPGRIRVLFDGPPKSISVTWRRIDDLPETVSKRPPKTLESRYFPEGMSVDGNDLVVWAGGEEHEGIYQAEVSLPSDGEEPSRRVYLNATIRVAPMLPDKEITIKAGESKEDPADIDQPDIVLVTTPKPEEFIYYVTGFTPDSRYCKNPKWTIVDAYVNTSRDISKKVHREDDSKFVINYPLVSGKHIRFQCLPVPTTNLSGSLRFEIDSPDMRIILRPEYDDPDSVYPTRLVCMEANPQISAEISISSSKLSKDELQNPELPSPAAKATGEARAGVDCVQSCL